MGGDGEGRGLEVEVLTEDLPLAGGAGGLDLVQMVQAGVFGGQVEGHVLRRAGVDQDRLEVGVAVRGRGGAVAEREGAVVAAAGGVGAIAKGLGDGGAALNRQAVGGRVGAVEEDAARRGEQATGRVVHRHRVVLELAFRIEGEAGRADERNGRAAVEAVRAAVRPGGVDDESVGAADGAGDDDGRRGQAFFKRSRIRRRRAG